MSEAKYKAGDQVTINGGDGEPVEVIDVVTLYYVNTYPTPMALRESQIARYVRPLAVGDRVRATSGMKGVIVATHNGEYWVDRGKEYGGCNTYQAKELERIPTEAGK